MIFINYTKLYTTRWLRIIITKLALPLYFLADVLVCINIARYNLIVCYVVIRVYARIICIYFLMINFLQNFNFSF